MFRGNYEWSLDIVDAMFTLVKQARIILSVHRASERNHRISTHIEKLTNALNPFRCFIQVWHLNAVQRDYRK